MSDAVRPRLGHPPPWTVAQNLRAMQVGLAGPSWIWLGAGLLPVLLRFRYGTTALC